VRLLTAVFASLVLSSVIGFSQGVVGGIPGEVLWSPPSPPEPPIRLIEGAPFSGEIISETVRTLRDGSQLTQSRTPSRIHRDSKGRVRYDRPDGLYAIWTDPPSPVLCVYDPVAKVEYTIDHKQRTYYAAGLPKAGPRFTYAFVRPAKERFSFFPYPTELPPGARNLPGATRLRSGEIGPLEPQRRKEDLGTKEIEGLLVFGQRTVDVAPLGWEGFDRPLEMSVEVWVSREIDCLVLWKMSDPRVGEATWKLTHIDRSEPDADLFRVPPGFTRVTQ